MTFYGQFSPQQDEYLFNNFFKNKKNGISIEAGASNGVLENNTKFFEETLEWKTINVEPLPIWYEQLCKNRPNSVNLNYALHQDENETDIHFHIPNIEKYKLENHLGSLNNDNLLKYNREIKTITVKTITFNKIIEMNNLKEINLFILDIEGYELEFLKSFDEWLIYPEIFCVEIGHLDENKINNIVLKKYDLYGKHFVNNIYVLKK